MQVSPEEERQLEMTWVKLQQMEENTRKLYKEVKKYEECLAGVQVMELFLIAYFSKTHFSS